MYILAFLFSGWGYGLVITTARTMVITIVNSVVKPWFEACQEQWLCLELGTSWLRLSLHEESWPPISLSLSLCIIIDSINNMRGIVLTLLPRKG